MQRLPLIINGVDFSTAASRLEYQIEYEDRVGENTTMMLNGDEYPDVLDRRPIITWQLNALWSDELAALYAAIGDGQYVPVLYFDTRTNAEQVGVFRASISRQQIGMINARGKMFHGPTLTLRSR